jgi:predicted alpha/beta-fold hydrolase
VSSQTQLEIEPFIPRRWLGGGHMQTIASFLIPRHIQLPPSERRMVEVEPGVATLCHCHWQPDRRSPMTVIIVHGFEGSTESQYMTAFAAKGLAAGMNVIRMNQRNCGGTDCHAPVLYHSGLSGDVAAVAKNLIDNDGVSRFAVVGYSMGGNLVLKAAGEWGSHGPSQFRAAAAVCPAIDLAASSDALHLPANRLYEQYFLRQVRRRLRLKASHFPGVFDLSRLEGIHSLRQFDDRITAYYCGFSGAVDYYARASATNVVDRIAVPTLILHAGNDPFVRLLPETRKKIHSNPNIQFFETADGGHCSFIAAPNGYDGFWAERQIINFLRQF